MTEWRTMSNGVNGKIGWLYITHPDDKPKF
jgi:hypothetical protein